MTARKRISIITPCYKEGPRVRACYEAVTALFAGDLSDYDYEIVFADNCSTDDTPQVLRELAAQDPNVALVFNSRNVGVVRSVFNALRHATGDAVVVMMAVDLQDPPEMIVEFVRQWANGYDVVQGVRVKRDESLSSRFVRHTYYRIVRALAQIDIPADVGEFQLIDRKVLNCLLQFDDHNPYIRGMIAYLGFKTCQLPYVLRASKRGFSHNRLLMLIDIALNGMLTFSKKPIRLMSITGGLVAAASVLYAVVNLLWVLLFNRDAIGTGIPTLIVAFFFLAGLNFLFLGLIGEYVLAIHHQVRFGGRVFEADSQPRRSLASETSERK